MSSDLAYKLNSFRGAISPTKANQPDKDTNPLSASEDPFFTHKVTFQGWSSNINWKLRIGRNIWPHEYNSFDSSV